MSEYIPVNREGKVIGKVQKVEYDAEKGGMCVDLEIFDKETIEKIRVNVNGSFESIPDLNIKKSEK